MRVLGNLLADLLRPPGRTLSKAWGLIEADRDEEAGRLCREILERHPAHAGALHCSGVLALRQERFGDAAELLRRALQTKQHDRQIHYDLAEACRLTGLWEEAGAHYEPVLADKPDMLAARIGLAECLFSRGELEIASRHCGEALDCEPFNDRALALAASLALHRKAPAQALGAIEVALARDPANVHRQHALAKLWIGEGRIREAGEVLARVLSADDADDIHYSLICLIESAARQNLMPVVQPREAPAVEDDLGQPLISIIICSIDSHKYAAVSANYAALLAGERYEIIGIHDARSLCEGYNRGASQARGDILIFSHDDVEILSQDFAPRLKRHLSHHDLIGPCGTIKMVSGHWMEAGWPHLRGLVVHRYPATGPSAGMYRALVFDTLAENATGGLQGLDGMFIAMRRSVLDICRFDEETFDGFHLYDLDFTYAAYLSGLDVAAFRDIAMVHSTSGDAPGYQQTFDRYYCRFQDKYRGQLAPPPPPSRHCYAAILQTREQAGFFCQELLAFRQATIALK